MRIRSHFLYFALFSAFFFNLVTQAASQETSTENASGNTSSKPLSELPETKIAIWFATLTTVFVGGLGDKTFLIAAFMSMKFPALLILVGASAALTIILGASAAFGAVVPELIPPSLIHVVIIVLFFFFGAKFLYEAYTFKDQKMQDDQNEVQHQIDMVESKLMRSSIIKSGKHDHHDNEVPLINLENKPSNHPLLQIAQSVSEEIVLPSPISPKVHQFDQPEPKFELDMVNKRAILIEIFSMVFLAEWGDRSQIYTIALASQYNGFIVFLGAILGHIGSLIVAIIGGRLFAERISERTILFIAGILYILLGIFTIID